MQESKPVSIFLLQRTSAAWSRNVPPVSVLVDGLGQADQQRYMVMGSSKRRTEFLAGRLLLRYALRHCYGDASDRWRLIAPAEMGLRLEGDGVDDHPPAISIAHSSGVVVCAVADLPRLGVDVEHYHARNGDMADLAEAALHASELTEMAGLTAIERKHYFFRRWTLKEAMAKALGIGLALPFREFGFIDHRLAQSPEDWNCKGEHWGFANLAAGTNMALGLAWTTKRQEDVVTVSLHGVEEEILLCRDIERAAVSALTAGCPAATDLPARR